MKTSRFILGLVCATLFCSGPALAANVSKKCASLVPSAESNSRLQTDSFIGYLAELYEEKILSGDDLLKIYTTIQSDGKVLNPFQTQDHNFSSSKLIHQEGLQAYIDSQALNREVLNAWLNETLKIHEEESQQKEVVQTETYSTALKMDFKKMPFNFQRSESPAIFGYVTAGKPYALEIMSTPVTQAQWLEAMRDVKAHHSAGEHESLKVIKDGKEIQLNPNHPVENITFWSALEFANRLSDLQNLEPAYNLDEFTMEGSAAEGTLKPIKSELSAKSKKLIRFLIELRSIDEKEGYRLPRDGELIELYKTLNAQWKTEDLDKAKIFDFILKNSWHATNSPGKKTQAVASGGSLTIAGVEFFDLFGNVETYTNRAYIGNNGQPLTYIYGGSYQSWPGDLTKEATRESSPASANINLASPSIGIRLVRSLPPIENLPQK